MGLWLVSGVWSSWNAKAGNTALMNINLLTIINLLFEQKGGP
jgi:hypothetical protein